MYKHVVGVWTALEVATFILLKEPLGVVRGLRGEVELPASRLVTATDLPVLAEQLERAEQDAGSLLSDEVVCEVIRAYTANNLLPEVVSFATIRLDADVLDVCLFRDETGVARLSLEPLSIVMSGDQAQAAAKVLGSAAAMLETLNGAGR